MKNTSIKDLKLWQFDSLIHEPSVQHFVTDRNTRPQQKEFTLSYSSVPDRNEVLQNRMALADALNIPESHLYFPSQLHKTKIVNVTSLTSKDEVLETDALITNEKG